MPESDPPKNEDGKGKVTEPPAGSIEVDYGGEKKRYANLEELRADAVRLHGMAKKGAGVLEENKRLSKVEELAKAVVLTGTPDAERQFYSALGLDEREIGKLMDSSEGQLGDGEDSDETKSRTPLRRSPVTDRNGKKTTTGEVDYDLLTDTILRRLEGKLSFKHYDDDSLGLLQDIADRVESASSVVSKDTDSSIRKVLSADKLVGEYWKVLKTKQQDAALRNVLAEVGFKPQRGVLPKTEELEKVRMKMRNYLADVYGPIEDVRRGHSGGIPTVLDFGGDSSGFESLSDEELTGKVTKLDSPDTPEGRGPSGLADRMRLAFEMSKRKDRAGAMIQ